jgi:hypothetical protein
MSDMITLSKLVIIDSLEANEFQTGQEIEIFARAEFSLHNLPLLVERHSVLWPADFEKILLNLTADAARGMFPILHVETHGDPKDGLEFASGSTMSWSRVSELLVDLNRATRFNLVCVFAACYGAYFAGQMWVHKPAPCFGLLAPEDTVDPGEIYRGFRVFYGELARTRDMGAAAALLAREKLTRGRWMNQTAPIWLPKVLRATAEHHLSAEGLKAMAARIKARAEAEDLPPELNLEPLSEETARRYLSETAFHRFFMVMDIPENADRFRSVQERVIREILPLVGQ